MIRNTKLIYTITIILVCVSVHLFAPVISKANVQDENSISWTSSTKAHTAVVVDGILATLRKEPEVTSPIKQRLRVGRKIYILQTKVNKNKQIYYWVAVTRRTRGWIDSRAIAVQNKKEEDTRLWNLIQTESNEYERMRLCCIFLNLFKRSNLIPKILLDLGKTADHEAYNLTKRADKRIQQLPYKNAEVKSYYDNDPVLDRYNHLGILFIYDTDKYKYNGWAYNQLVTKYPNSPEANLVNYK